MLIFKEAVFLLLAFLDAQFTKRKLWKYGIGIEMNPMIRMFCGLFGLERGVDLGVLIPTGGLMFAGWFHPELLAFLIGVRFCLFLLQIRTRGI